MVLKSCLFFRQLSIIEKKSRRFHIKIVKNDSNKNSPKTINYFLTPNTGTSNHTGLQFTIPVASRTMVGVRVKEINQTWSVPKR